MDYNFLWGVIALACGTVMLVYGATMFRIVLLCAGFYIGFSVVSLGLGGLDSGPNPWVRTTIALVLGAALGGILFSMVRITVYAAGAILGLVVALLFMSLIGFGNGWLISLIGLSGAGFGAIVGPKLGSWLTIIASALAGAYVSVLGLAKLFGVPETGGAGTMPVTSSTLVVFTLLAVISMLAQSRVGTMQRVTSVR
jgi:hypothetical protein